jgi:hypothetical protein
MVKYFKTCFALTLLTILAGSCSSDQPVDMEELKKRCGEEIVAPLEDCHTELKNTQNDYDSLRSSYLPQLDAGNCATAGSAIYNKIKYLCTNDRNGVDRWGCQLETTDPITETYGNQTFTLGPCAIKCGRQGPVPPHHVTFYELKGLIPAPLSPQRPYGVMFKDPTGFTSTICTVVD